MRITIEPKMADDVRWLFRPLVDKITAAEPTAAPSPRLLRMVAGWIPGGRVIWAKGWRALEPIHEPENPTYHKDERQ